MKSRCVFDLDNTLVFTDELNHEAYNYALKQEKLKPIATCKRMTREIVFEHYPHLTEWQKERIIDIKQKYFVENVRYTTPNTYLINLLLSKHAKHCVLWTSADMVRVQAMLKFYRIEGAFISVVYSDKCDLSRDIEMMCSLFSCNPAQLVFFEDNQNTVTELRALGQRVWFQEIPPIRQKLGGDRSETIDIP